MAQNYIESGERLDYVVPEGAEITSGQIVKVGSMAGVALGSGIEDEVVVVAMKGVFTLPKIAGAITQGAPVYSNGEGSITTAEDDGEDPATAFVKVGYAWSAAENADTTVNVVLAH